MPWRIPSVSCDTVYDRALIQCFDWEVNGGARLIQKKALHPLQDWPNLSCVIAWHVLICFKVCVRRVCLYIHTYIHTYIYI